MNMDTAPRVLRSGLGRVRHLGSARSGTHHWISQRVTSIALLPLVLWFVLSMIGLSGASHIDTLLWLAAPLNAVLMLALIGLTFHHVAQGLQVVIEDYLRPDTAKFVALLLLRSLCWLAAMLSAFAVLRVALLA
jgi:succinate dehydrogenase / fumarate reductase membrane anchor subunit